MRQYLDLLNHILHHGTQKSDRTGTGTKSAFWYQMHIPLDQWFPLLTTKKVFFKAVVHELLWFISGNTNIRYLVQNGVHIRNERPFEWYLQKNNLSSAYPRYSDSRKEKLQEFVEQIKNDEQFSKEWWELGPVYGRQRRNFGGVDQLSRVLQEIKHNPDSRRLIVSARNPPEVEQMAKAGLPPCHTLFQFYVVDGKLSCQLYQRSADVFLGVPFNIASYALLTHLVAHVSGLQPWTFVHTFGDVHIYNTHFAQVEEQLSREPKKLPTLRIRPSCTDIFACTAEDIELLDYDPWPAIKASVAV